MQLSFYIYYISKSFYCEVPFHNKNKKYYETIVHNKIAIIGINRGSIDLLQYSTISLSNIFFKDLLSIKFI